MRSTGIAAKFANDYNPAIRSSKIPTTTGAWVTWHLDIEELRHLAWKHFEGTAKLVNSAEPGSCPPSFNFPNSVSAKARLFT